MGEPERVTEERKSLNTTLETLKKAIKVLQRDPNITNSVIGEEELQDELRSMQQEKRQQQNERP